MSHTCWQDTALCIARQALFVSSSIAGRAKADGAFAGAVTHLRKAGRAKSASTQEKKSSHRLGQTTSLCSSLVMLSLSPSSPCRPATQAFDICFFPALLIAHSWASGETRF